MVFRRTFLAACCLTAATPAMQAAVEQVIAKTFQAGPGSKVVVNTFHGGITVVSSDSDQIEVRVIQSVEVDTKDAAEKRLRDIDVAFAHENGMVLVHAKYTRTLRWVWDAWPPALLSFELKVPRHIHLDLLTHDGAITVDNLHGTVRARTLNGAIFTGEIDGEVTATSLLGDVAVTACTGKLELTAKAGNVLVGRSGGPTTLSGAGGAVEVQRARNVVVADADGSDLKVGFVHPIVGGSELRASGGDVIVNLDPASACSLDVRASTFGYIRLRDLALTPTSGAEGASRLTGDLNGGGPTIVVRASGGNVRLVGMDP